MSVATPSGSAMSVAASPAPNVGALDANDRLVYEYLKGRGHTAIATSLLEELQTSTPTDGASKKPETVAKEDLVASVTAFAPATARPGENALKDSSTVTQELKAIGNTPSIQNIIANVSGVGAEELLSLDPTDKQGGFRELEAWVEGSLDMYRVCIVCIQAIPVAHVYMTA